MKLAAGKGVHSARYGVQLVMKLKIEWSFICNILVLCTCKNTKFSLCAAQVNKSYSLHNIQPVLIILLFSKQWPNWYELVPYLINKYF